MRAHKHELTFVKVRVKKNDCLCLNCVSLFNFILTSTEKTDTIFSISFLCVLFHRLLDQVRVRLYYVRRVGTMSFTCVSIWKKVTFRLFLIYENNKTKLIECIKLDSVWSCQWIYQQHTETWTGWANSPLLTCSCFCPFVNLLSVCVSCL